ncbi:MAG: heme exporter protein CcmD [Pseudomonadota bacterium]
MIDLGQYAAEVLFAYGSTFALLGLLVILTVLRARRVRKALEDAEGSARRG